MPVVQSSGVSISSAVVLWDNYININNLTANSSPASNPVENIIDPSTWSSWKPTGTIPYAYVDLGAETKVDAWGISGHNLYSAGVTNVQLAVSNTGSGWTSASGYVPTTDDDLLFLIGEQSYRYYRIGLYNGTGVSVSNIILGKRLVFPYAPLDDYVPLYYGRQYTKLINESLRGQVLGNRVIAAGAQTEVDLGPLSRTWVDNNVKGFKNHYDQGGTFFYASCPNKYPQDMGYCWAPEQESAMNITYTDGANNATVNFGLRAYVAQ